jgi:hypothetical protein
LRFRIWVAAILGLAGVLLLFAAVWSKVQQPKLSIIPWPEKVERLRGTFLLRPVVTLSSRNRADFERRVTLRCQLLDRMGVAHHAAVE